MKNSSTYAARSLLHKNPAAKALLNTIERKNTNLCIAADVTTKSELLIIADIIVDFDKNLIEELKNLCEKHDFLIFEDRKFADIGEGIVSGLKEVGLPLDRGLLLLAEMSSQGTLAKGIIHLVECLINSNIGQYTLDTLEMARKNMDFVIGFIGQKRLENEKEDFIYMTPGVNMEVTGDTLGQQYRTPRQVILEEGLDIIIVGRGIYGSQEKNIMVEKAKLYRDAGWKAYLERLSV
ncbi:orotidine 5'-phosphate decarboxylase [Clydaea vesicula]|uniref:Orotidine 5'-phosphate decarboxylase n=1 Tax=Clydaea vesicula TaxID=447962 RepID=A0AAD5U8A6_9FUNG|nr:orotidine 5'-phosphate decarboxylase [Clydaea vesicula]